MTWCSVALYLASLAEVGQGRTLSRVEIAAIAWGVNILSGIINTVGTKAIGSISTFNVWWTLGGTVVLVITLLVKAPVKVEDIFLHSSHSNVSSCRTPRNSFSQTSRSRSKEPAMHSRANLLRSFTGWGSKGFVVLLGFLQV
jgi:amino acid transporter